MSAYLTLAAPFLLALQALSKDKKTLKDIRDSSAFKSASSYQLNEAGKSMSDHGQSSPDQARPVHLPRAACPDNTMELLIDVLCYSCVVCRVGSALRQCAAVRALAGHAGGPGRHPRRRRFPLVW